MFTRTPVHPNVRAIFGAAHFLVGMLKVGLMEKVQWTTYKATYIPDVARLGSTILFFILTKISTLSLVPCPTSNWTAAQTLS